MIGDALGYKRACLPGAGKLAGDGVIEINNHTLKVLDQAALAREAGTEARPLVHRQGSLPIAA